MKIISGILLILFLFSGTANSQTIVSTNPENKKIVLEEYGGIYCGYCPDGNQIAESILATYPEQVFRINIHEGLYANPENGDPDFRSDYGETYSNQTGLIGYPAGTINRMVFSGLEQGSSGTTALGRGHWSDAVLQELDQPSIVNIAANATVDYESNELEILVELYYTGNSEASSNFLNIALVQNNIHGPQTGGNEESNYIHNNLLRDMITEQWGDTIGSTYEGHFEARSYTYLIPPHFREIPFDSPNMELVIFITESHQKILNGISVKPDFIVQNVNDANALLMPSPEVVCGDEITPVFTLRNEGNAPLNSLLIEYKINEETTHTYQWSGYLTTFETEEITLPTINFDGLQNDENNIFVSVNTPNGWADENSENNLISAPFEIAPSSATASVILELKMDGFGYDIYWEVTDENKNVIAFGGNENVGENGGGIQTGSPSDPGAYGDYQSITEQFELPDEGCYTFRVLDDYGDGLCCQYGYGFYYLQDEQGNIIFTGGEFHIEKNEPFSFGSTVTATENQNFNNNLIIYPNPITGGELFFEITLGEPEAVKVELFTADNRISYSGTELISTSGSFKGHIDTRTLPSGIYFLKLSTPEASVSRKVVLLR